MDNKESYALSDDDVAKFFFHTNPWDPPQSLQASSHPQPAHSSPSPHRPSAPEPQFPAHHVSSPHRERQDTLHFGSPTPKPTFPLEHGQNNGLPLPALPASPGHDRDGDEGLDPLAMGLFTEMNAKQLAFLLKAISQCECDKISPSSDAARFQIVLSSTLKEIVDSGPVFASRTLESSLTALIEWSQEPHHLQVIVDKYTKEDRPKKASSKRVTKPGAQGSRIHKRALRHFIEWTMEDIFSEFGVKQVPEGYFEWAFKIGNLLEPGVFKDEIQFTAFVRKRQRLQRWESVRKPRKRQKPVEEQNQAHTGEESAHSLSKFFPASRIARWNLARPAVWKTQRQFTLLKPRCLSPKTQHIDSTTPNSATKVQIRALRSNSRPLAPQIQLGPPLLQSSLEVLGSLATIILHILGL
ncbi:hypothetical protein T439DRAFT_379138 [Meredithblackwellia eburnea MCA 4105]